MAKKDLTQVGDDLWVIPDTVVAIELHNAATPGNFHCKIFIEQNGVAFSVVSDYTPAAVAAIVLAP